jgi:hypothetical protein
MKAVNIAVADVRNADISLKQCTVIIMVGFSQWAELTSVAI